MKLRKFGKTGIQVSGLGLGAMPMSIQGRPEESQSIAVIHRALDLGITLIDTADAYCVDEKDKHHNERLIAKALSQYAGDKTGVIIATKGGLLRPQGRWEVNGDPKHIAKTIRESFEALGGDRPIPLWQLHAVDDRFPIDITLKPVREAVDEGLIRFVGLSNVTVDEIRRARDIVGVISVQNEYNPWCRDPEKDGVLDYCEKNNIIFLPWSPLGGSSRVRQLSHFPSLNTLSQKKNASPAQLILAWMMAKASCILPIPGSSRLETLLDSAKAVDVTLEPDEFKMMNSLHS